MLDVGEMPKIRPCSINRTGRWAKLAPSLVPAPDPAPAPARAPAPTPVPIATLIPTPTPTPATRLTTGLSVFGANLALEDSGIDAAEFPRLICFDDEGVFRYGDLVSGEEFTDSVSRFGRVPNTPGISTTDSFRVITRSSTRPKSRTLIAGGTEHRVTGKGVVSRPRSMASADRSRFSSTRPLGWSAALKGRSGFGSGF